MCARRRDLLGAVVEWPLEPPYCAKTVGKEQSHEQAPSLLFDLHADADRTREKTSLLDSIAAEAPRSPLRAGAFQRMALIRFDRGGRPGAWGLNTIRW